MRLSDPECWLVLAIFLVATAVMSLVFALAGAVGDLAALGGVEAREEVSHLPAGRATTAHHRGSVGERGLSPPRSRPVISGRSG